MKRITNSVISEMVSAWPHLRYLDLAQEYNIYLDSGVDIAGFCEFSRCRHLKTLAININASRLDELALSTLPGRASICKTMWYLDLGRSPIRDPRAVAAVIFDIFPRLHPWCVNTDNFCPNIPHDFQQQQIWIEFQAQHKSFYYTKKQKERASANS